MNDYETFFSIGGLIRCVGSIARELGYDGNLYDDEQRQWRDPSFEEKHGYREIFRSVGEVYFLDGESWTFVSRLCWNAVMNSSQSKKELGL